LTVLVKNYSKFSEVLVSCIWRILPYWRLYWWRIM